MSHRKEIKSWPVSRVLSRTVIPLGSPSLTTSSNLPESSAGHTNGFLFGLAPSGVYHATDCYQLRGALLPHLFTLTGAYALRRFAFCCTFRRLAPPRRYLALYPVEPGLSSIAMLAHHHSDCPANSPPILYPINANYIIEINDEVSKSLIKGKKVLINFLEENTNFQKIKEGSLFLAIMSNIPIAICSLENCFLKPKRVFNL